MPLITWNKNDSSKYMVLHDDFYIGKYSSSYGCIRATEGKTYGKYYWEITINKISNSDTSNIIVGVCNKKQKLDGFVSCSGLTETKGYYDSGQKLSPYKTGYGEKYYNNDVISILLDLDNNTIEFWKNGKSQGVAFDDLEKTEWFPCVWIWTNFECTANFGASQFKYDIPNGYLPYDKNNAGWWLIKFLIKIDNKYYTIRPEFYSDNKFNSIGLEGGNYPNLNDCNKLAFKKIKTMLDEMNVNNEIFRPIDKLDKFKVIIIK